MQPQQRRIAGIPGLLDLSCKTVSGLTIGEIVAKDAFVVAPAIEPATEPGSGAGN